MDTSLTLNGVDVRALRPSTMTFPGLVSAPDALGAGTDARRVVILRAHLGGAVTLHQGPVHPDNLSCAL